MRTKIIVRCEDQQGVGVYSSSKSAFIHGKTNPTFHPDPYADKGLRYVEHLWSPTMRDWYFGFISKEQALNWFYVDDWLIKLHECGIVVSEYVCNSNDVICGDHQAIFRSSERKQSYNILSYFGLTEK